MIRDYEQRDIDEIIRIYTLEYNRLANRIISNI